MNISKLIGQNLKALRQKSGLTQSDLSELCDISPGTLANLETGGQLLHVTHVYKISAALGVPVHIIVPEKSFLLIQGMTQDEKDAIYALQRVGFEIDDAISIIKAKAK